MFQKPCIYGLLGTTSLANAEALLHRAIFKTRELGISEIHQDEVHMSTNDELAKTSDGDQIDENEAGLSATEVISLETTYSPQNVLLLRHLEQSQSRSNSAGVDAHGQPFPPPVTIDSGAGIQTLETAPAEKIDTKPVVKESTTVFTEPYNKEKAQLLIKKLEDNKFDTRIAAQNTLARMGPKILPDLEKAVKESADSEVRLRAGEAIKFIKTNALREDTVKYLAQADQSIKRTESLLSLAGISVIREKTIVADDAGNRVTIGPVRLHGKPPGNLTAENRKEFEEMIKQGDALASERRLGEIEKHVKEHGEWDDYVKLAVLRWSKDARIFYARALSVSNDPKNKQKGIELLTEYMDKNKDFKPDESFTELAVELRADKDEVFMKAFKKAGGDLDKLSDLVDLVINKDLYHANVLTGSRDPNQHQKGTELLTKYLQENKNYKPDEFFIRVAAQLGAHNNEAFLKIFKGAGGDVAELTGWINKVVSARKREAQNLSTSADPVDHERGIELLTELLQKYPKDFKQDKSFLTLAVRFGAHNNESFMKAFRNAGNNVEELKKAAEELRKKE